MGPMLKEHSLIIERVNYRENMNTLKKHISEKVHANLIPKSTLNLLGSLFNQ